MEWIKQTIVLLVFWRRAVAEHIMLKVGELPDVEAVGVYSFSEARSAAVTYQPAVALVEIPERRGEPAIEALAACDDIKEVVPLCKTVLLCPESDDESVQVCVDAKKAGSIDDFLFYDSSVYYTLSKLESLCP